MSDLPLDLPTDPDALVTRFCAAWSNRDVDELVAYFADDAVYHNMPMDPAVGKEAIRAAIDMLMGMTSKLEFEVLNQVAAGRVVMNERIDTLVMGDDTTELPVAGVFEVDDGRISAWRDYFDLSKLMG